MIAVLTAALFLGEGLHAQQWAGAGLVLVAAILASWPRGPRGGDPAASLGRPET